MTDGDITGGNERLAIARDILLASPPGQFDLIADDLRTMFRASDQVLDPSFVTAARGEWEASTNRSALNGSGENDGDETNVPVVSSLRRAMDGYVGRKFSSSGVRAGHRVVVEGGGPQISVVTYAERIDIQNCHAGSWTGHWTVDPSSGSVIGRASVRAHAFENGGNVQLHSDTAMQAANHGAASGAASEEEWAEAVVRQIEEWEDKKVQGELMVMYESMGTRLKSLRRVMPITRTKMDWNVTAHRLVKNLAEDHDNARRNSSTNF